MEEEGIEIKLEKVEEIKVERPWIEEFYNCVGNSLFLANQGNDSSFKQGYILLDNSVEQFLKNYIIHIKKKTEFDIKKQRSIKEIKFIHIILESKDQNNKTICDILDRVLQYHDARNNLYHSAQLLSVYKRMISDYINDMISFCELIGFVNSKNFIGKSYHIIFRNILDKNMEMRLKSIKKIQYLLNEVFQIMPGDYSADIMLGSPSGYSEGAIHSIKLFILGSIASEDNNKKTRIIELIDNDENDAFHTFFVSHVDSNIWYCYYRCFWSKSGKGDDYYIRKIRNFIDIYKNRIDYRVEYRRKESISFDIAFDPMFVDDKEHIISLTRQSINGNKKLSMYEYEKYDDFYLPR